MSSSSRVPRDSPVCPCSAAVPRRSHTCGADSSCRLCSGGRALPCFPPGTPHAWPSYLVTHKRNARMLKLGRGRVRGGGEREGGGGAGCFDQVNSKLRTKWQRTWKELVTIICPFAESFFQHEQGGTGLAVCGECDTRCGLLQRCF